MGVFRRICDRGSKGLKHVRGKFYRKKLVQDAAKSEIALREGIEEDSSLEASSPLYTQAFAMPHSEKTNSDFINVSTVDKTSSI
jgi:hypothetical protein